MNSKWIDLFRNNINESGLDASTYSDQEVLTMSKGFMAQQLADEAGIERSWVFELYWQALMTMDPNQVIDTSEGNIVDLEKFKRHVKNNTN